MYPTEQPDMQGCKRTRGMSEVDAATDSNAVVMTCRSLRDHSPGHDHHMIAIAVSRRASAVRPGTAHSLSLPAVITDSRVRRATDHPSGIEAG